jgi:hypothetical protein
MWLSDKWKDYEVLDTSEARKAGALGGSISWCGRTRR